MNKLFYTFLIFAFSITAGNAQTLIAEESFEGTAGEHGYTTVPATQCACCTSNPYVTWERTDNSSTCITMDVSGIDGTYFWAAEKIDDDNMPPNPLDPNAAIILDPVAITGVSNMEIRVAVGQGALDHFDSGDYLRIQYALNGSASYITVAQFIPVAAENSNLAYDANFDNIIDGATLSQVLTEFTADLGNITGNTISIRLLFKTSSFHEEIVVDHIQLFGEMPLPAELGRFTAGRKADAVELKWLSNSEQQLSGYEIQRKGELGDWSRIGWLDSKGSIVSTAHYKWEDKAPVPGWQYYRLKLVDEDGSYTYSPQQAVFFEYQYSFSLGELFPNPLTQGTRLNFPVISKKALEMELRVFSADGGKLIYSDSQRTSPGTTLVNVGTENLPAGVYIIELKIADVSQFRKLVIW